MVKSKKELLLRIRDAEALLVNMGKEMSPTRFDAVMAIMHSDTRKFVDRSDHLTEDIAKFQ